ncbi:MAG: peptidylprolyl isomerase, partial [Chromatiaceae bacterium]
MRPAIIVVFFAALIGLAASSIADESAAENTKAGQANMTEEGPMTVHTTANKPERVVMARVGDAEITVEDFIGFISLNPEKVRSARGIGGKADILRTMIANILLQQAMAKEGLLPKEQQPEAYQAALRLLADKYFPAPNITDEAALLAYYEANRDQFGIPASARLSQISFRYPKDADDAAKQAVKERADQVLSRLEAGETFANLAREVSENPGSKESGGDLGFIERVTWSNWLKNALSGVDVGKHTGVVPSPIGYEILMITEERPAIIAPFAEVKEDIRKKLQLAAQDRLRNDYVKRLATG